MDNTQRIDAFADPHWGRIFHAKDYIASRIGLEVAQDPEGSALRQRVLRLHRRLFERYPDPKTAGWFSFTRFKEDYKKYRPENVFFPMDVTFFKSYLEKDGADFVIAKFDPKKFNLVEADDVARNPDHTVTLPEIVKELEDFLDHKDQKSSQGQ